MSEKLDITKFTTAELTAELWRRVSAGADLRNPDGTMPDALWGLVREYSIIACTDAIPVRVDSKTGQVQLGAIVRNGGKYKGKFAQIGGRMMVGENPQMALTRHVKTDLGLDFNYYDSEAGPNKPLYVTSYKPKKEGNDERPEVFADDPTKHSLAMTFLVTIPDDQAMSFGKGAGGQEASGFQWFSAEELAKTADTDFAFEQRHLYVKAFAEIRRLQEKRAQKVIRASTASNIFLPSAVFPYF